jgi:hypothetical protein
VKFSTFHSFMLVDAKLGGAVAEGQGFGVSPARAIQDELELIAYADELGYDTCWVREHHFTQYGFLPNTMALLAHAAARTERIRLGTAVVTLPLHHPIRAAEDAALVDVLSGGRLALGIGRGYQSIEFEAFGIPLAESRARTDEAIEIMRRLWSATAPIDFEGRFFQFHGITLQPKPVQQPLPIHYASISRETSSTMEARASRSSSTRPEPRDRSPSWLPPGAMPRRRTATLVAATWWHAGTSGWPRRTPRPGSTWRRRRRSPRWPSTLR